MKSLEEAIGYDFQCFDSRDKVRLIGFVPKEKLLQTGWLKKDANLSDLPKTKSWTRENVLEQLKEDVLFGWDLEILEISILNFLSQRKSAA